LAKFDPYSGQFLIPLDISVPAKQYRSRMSGGSQQRLKETNRALVVDQLRAEGGLSRAQLARRTGLSRTTISNLVGELMADGLAIEPGDDGAAVDADGKRSSAGRPSRKVMLDVSAGAAVSIDIGARHMSVAVGDLGHRVLARRWVTLAHGHGFETGLDAAETMVAELLGEANVEREQVIGVAAGLPAPVSYPEGLVASTNILPGWAGVALSRELSERLQLPAVVDNDANLGALAEATRGAGAGGEQVAYIKVATGIGAGLIHSGRLFRGSSGTAGEIGHVTVAADGPICRCGNRGCLELYAGGGALLEAIRSNMPEIDSIEKLVDRALEGDKACQRVIGDAGMQLGVAAAGMVNLLGPDRIVIGGELSRAGDLLLEPMRTAVARSAVRTAAEQAVIVAASLGAEAEVLGGLLLVLTEPGRFGADNIVAGFREPDVIASG
jgi:predicted NBD/HSP70 family sugar kinase